MKNAGEVLQNWESVNRFLLKSTEEETKELLEVERRGMNRLSIVLRLYGRFSKLRHRRERSELVTGSNT